MIQLPPPIVALAGSELITVPWYNYFTNQANAAGYPLDAFDFGVTGDGTTDDTDALQAFLDELGSVGGIGFIRPGQYKITSGLTLTPGGDVSSHLQGDNAFITPSSSIATFCLTVNHVAPESGLGNVGQTIIEGLGFYHPSSSTILGSITNLGRNRVSFRNIKTVTPGTISASFVGIRITVSGGGHAALYNEIRDCSFAGDDTTHMPVGINIQGLSNFTTIQRNILNRVDEGISVEYLNGVTGVVAAAIRIIDNDFEHNTNSIKIHSLNVAGASLAGYRIWQNYFETISSNCIDLSEMYQSNTQSTVVGLNHLAASVNNFVNNPNTVEWYDLATTTLRTDSAATTPF